MADKELAKLNQAELALENAEDIQDFINLRTYGKTLNVLLEAQERKEDAQRAKIFQIKAQIKAGQWLDENIAHKGGDAATLSNDMTAIPEGITRDESSRWQKQYKAGMDKFDEYIDKCLAEDKEISEAGFMRFITGAHVGQNSGENEWYTPKVYIDAARYVMSSIDIDPASSDKANEIVKATKYYTIDDNGLEQPWDGNVWMNPPYAQPLVSYFTKTLIEKWISGEIQQACVLVNNATETNWYQPMLDYANAVCFIKGRVKFINKNGNPSGAPLQGQTVLYFGGNIEKFTKAFGELGKVLYASR
jgi:ParB family chromosome partitioning protein